MTVWRKIPGLEERYEASEYGEIRSLPYEVKVVAKNGTVKIRHIDGKVLKPRIYENGKSRGHPVVSISGLTSSGAKVGEQRVSLMVARAFHGCPYEPGDMAASNRWRIIHLDGDVTNVCADNLEWATSNGGSPDSESYKLYEENMRKLEEQRNEPLIVWGKRIFGEDFALDEAEESAHS